MEIAKQTFAYYGKADIYDFLQRAGYSAAADCWENEHSTTGKITTEAVIEWLHNLFPAKEAFAVYLHLDNEVTAYWGWEI